MGVPGAAQHGAMPRFTNLGDLIQRDRDLDKVAIIDLGGQLAHEVSYAELDAMTTGVARALCARGLARGERVAILSANRAEYLAAYYGIMRAGLIAVPVSFKFPRSTIHFILPDAGAKLVFCDMARAPDCPPDIPAVHFGDEGAKGFDRFLDGGPFDAILPRAREPAMFLYTSGSTGMPKGVVLSHQSHLWVVETRLTGDLERHRYLIAAPLYHMNALALARPRRAPHPHRRAPAALPPPRLYRGDRTRPLHLAYRSAADDRHDAAREGPARPHRSLERRVHPHGFGARQSRADGGDPSCFAAGLGRHAFRPTRARS